MKSDTKTMSGSSVAKPFDTANGLMRAIEYLGDGLVVAAARFADAKCAIHVADWREAKRLLESGFAEFALHSRYRDSILGRLAGLHRRTRRGRKRGGGER